MQFKNEVEAVDALHQSFKNIHTEIGKVVIGQDEIVKQVLIAIFSNGHCLLVGVPGLAKTLLVQTVANVLDLNFNRIQFTPDLMPSDIIGAEILGEDRQVSWMRHWHWANCVIFNAFFHNRMCFWEVVLIVDYMPINCCYMCWMDMWYDSRNNISSYNLPCRRYPRRIILCW